MNKIIKLTGLGIGLSSVICNTIILIFNKSFYIGVVRFIPESNQLIRFVEILIGFFAIPVLILIMFQEMKGGN